MIYILGTLCEPIQPFWREQRRLPSAGWMDHTSQDVLLHQVSRNISQGDYFTKIHKGSLKKRKGFICQIENWPSFSKTASMSLGLCLLSIIIWRVAPGLPSAQAEVRNILWLFMINRNWYKSQNYFINLIMCCAQEELRPEKWGTKYLQ